MPGVGSANSAEHGLEARKREFGEECEKLLDPGRRLG